MRIHEGGRVLASPVERDRGAGRIPVETFAGRAVPSANLKLKHKFPTKRRHGALNMSA